LGKGRVRVLNNDVSTGGFDRAAAGDIINTGDSTPPPDTSNWSRESKRLAEEYENAGDPGDLWGDEAPLPVALSGDPYPDPERERPPVVAIIPGPDASIPALRPATEGSTGK